MSHAVQMKITDTDFDRELESLKSAAAISLNACLTAKYIALGDTRVRTLFLKKVQDGNVFRSIECFDVVSIPENKYLYFDFECAEGTFCLIKPAFLVVVDIVLGTVTGIIDPYILPASAGGQSSHGTTQTGARSGGSAMAAGASQEAVQESADSVRSPMRLLGGSDGTLPLRPNDGTLPLRANNGVLPLRQVGGLFLASDGTLPLRTGDVVYVPFRMGVGN
jgi:hypothetical protein